MRQRSRSYPCVSLETAIELAKPIFKAEGQTKLGRAEILRYWNYKASTGPGIQRVAALIQYGLMTSVGSGEGRRIGLSKRAVDILESDEDSIRQDLIRSAALSPKAISELWHAHNGILPPDAELLDELVAKRGFLEPGARQFITVLRETLEFAGLAYLREPEQEPHVPQRPPPGFPRVKRMSVPLPLIQEPEATISPPLAPEGVMVREIIIPLSAHYFAAIKAPFPMSREQWNMLHRILAAMELTWVKENDPE